MLTGVNGDEEFPEDVLSEALVLVDVHCVNEVVFSDITVITDVHGVVENLKVDFVFVVF